MILLCTQAEKSKYPLLYPLYLSVRMWAIKGSCLLANELVYCISPTPPALGGRLEDRAARVSLKGRPLPLSAALLCSPSLWPASHLLSPGPPSLWCTPWPFYGKKNLCGHHCFIISLQEGVGCTEGFGCRSVVGGGWGWVRGEVRLRTFRPDAPTLCTTQSCENINAHNVSSERFPGTTGGKGKFRDGGGNKTH